MLHTLSLQIFPNTRQLDIPFSHRPLRWPDCETLWYGKPRGANSWWTFAFWGCSLHILVVYLLSWLHLNFFTPTQWCSHSSLSPCVSPVNVKTCSTCTGNPWMGAYDLPRQASQLKCDVGRCLPLALGWLQQQALLQTSQISELAQVHAITRHILRFMSSIAPTSQIVLQLSSSVQQKFEPN